MSLSSPALSTFSNNILSETAELIETKLHVEPPWGWGIEACLIGLGHMTKMAATPIYGKNL